MRARTKAFARTRWSTNSTRASPYPSIRSLPKCERRSRSKEDNCNFVPTFTQRGATVVLVEYDLCPQVTVSDIVRQTRSAIGWTYKNIIRYGGDPSKLFVSGHSAGGHLTAMALAHDWSKDDLPNDLIKGAVATSGVYDLDMVMKISVQE